MAQRCVQVNVFDCGLRNADFGLEIGGGIEHGAWREGEKSGKSEKGEKGKSGRQGEGVIKVPGVGCQVSGKINIEAETLVIVICYPG